jgi:uncharacterized protein YwgA
MDFTQNEETLLHIKSTLTEISRALSDLAQIEYHKHAKQCYRDELDLSLRGAQYPEIHTLSFLNGCLAEGLVGVKKE